MLLSALVVGPANAQFFSDVASQAGLEFASYNTSGASWCDYDGDGDEDLFLPINGGSVLPNDLLARNEGNGQFSEVAQAAGVQGHTQLSFQRCAAWGDYDNDGDRDLFVTNTQPYQLFRNEGNGTFVDVAVAAGLGAGPTGGTSASWVDVDNDGWLDIYVTVWNAPNQLFHSNADGTFSELAATAGVAHGVAPSGCGAWCDYDGDGDMDLYSCSVDNGDPSRLFRNDGNLQFSDVSASSGLQPHRAFAATWADLNNDGHFDLYVSEVSTGALTGHHYINGGNGYLNAQGTASGLRWPIPAGVVARGASAADYDNDGHIDLYVTTSNTDSGTIPPANRMFHNAANGSFNEVAATLGVGDTRLGQGSSWADYDLDGDLDLYVTNDWPQACLLYRNDGALGHWARLSFVGTSSNRDAVGTRVRLRAHGGWQTRFIGGGDTGVNSQDSLPVEFGLGAATEIEMLVIDWPSGLQEVYTGLAGDSAHSFVEGAGSGCPQPVNYCIGAPNSSGPGSTLSWSGTTSLGANDLVLHASAATPSQFGVFYYGPAQVQLPLYDGFRCVGQGLSGVFRLQPAQVTDATGSVSRPLDFDSTPLDAGLGQVRAGDTWHFQFWYRDPLGSLGTGANLSDALSVTLCP